MSNIFLVGFMGSGKSTLGKKIANELKMNFIDSDVWIEKRANQKISDIFKEHGESHFRKLEKEFIEFAHILKHTIVATGAGLPCLDDHLEQMNQMGITVWLDVDENILVERLKNDSTPRPKLMEYSTIEEAIHSILENRKYFYRQAKLQIKNPTDKDLIELIKNKS